MTETKKQTRAQKYSAKGDDVHVVIRDELARKNLALGVKKYGSKIKAIEAALRKEF